ncbi:MAG: sporulation protein YqfD [Clostridia bacterium]
MRIFNKKTNVKVEITGLNLSSLLMKLSIYRLKNIWRHNKTLVFSINENDYNDAIKKEFFKCYKIKVLNNSGIITIAQRFFAVIGAVIGIILSFTIGFSYISIIHKIEIDEMYYKNMPIETRQRASIILREHGLCEGQLKKNIDIDKAEYAIITSLNDVSACVIEIKGVKCIVHLKKAQMVTHQKGADIVAPYSGMIMSIDTIMGKPNVKKNDRVNYGDILIKGNNLENAQGKIVLATQSMGSVLYNEENTKLEYTGKTKTETELYLTHPSLKERKVFDEQSTQIIEVKVFKNLFVPFTKRCIIYREMVRQKVKPFSEVEHIIKAQAESEALERSADGAVENISFAINRNGVIVRVDAYVLKLYTIS